MLGNATVTGVTSLNVSLVRQSGCDIDFPTAMGLAVASGSLVGTTTTLFNGFPAAVSASFGKVN